MTIDQMQHELDAMAAALPEEIFRDLNGGIILLPRTLQHEESGGDLFILGQYIYHPGVFGRYIAIYYGSFMMVHGRLSHDQQVEKLRGVLHHELTHHLENLAGDRSLERYDEEVLDEYLGHYYADEQDL